jgi:predicted nucleic acid-binding Zn ribbon protein
MYHSYGLAQFYDVPAKKTQREEGRFEKNCGVCGTYFRSNLKAAAYCSQDCRYDAARAGTAARFDDADMKAPARECTVCGEVFKSRRKTQQACGRSCGRVMAERTLGRG